LRWLAEWYQRYKMMPLISFECRGAKWPM
jgi:hypothetical protein